MRVLPIRCNRRVSVPLLLGGLFSVALALASQADPLPRVSSILGKTLPDDGLRLVLRLSEETAFTAFTLDDPERLVIDLPLVRWPVARPDPPDGVTALRYGTFSPTRSRLILDLSRPFAIDRAFTEAGRGQEPALLILDLSRTSEEAFGRMAGAPPAARWSGIRPTPPPAPAGALVVAIDPGHGGIDPGASAGGLDEKDLVLEIARILANRLSETPGYAAVMTRTGDEFVPLDERVHRAHAAGAHVFLSLHADSVEAGSASGVSIYTLNAAGTDQASENFAARENRADLLAGADLSGEADDVARLLIELSQRGTGSESRKLARHLIDALSDQVQLLGSRPRREANFRVLKAPDMPSVLLELGFLDDLTDRERLTDPDWRERFALAVVEGLQAWREVASAGFLREKSP